MSGENGPTEAQRRAFLDRLKSRPRGDADAPNLTAWFAPNVETTGEALENALDLMRTLIGTTRYFEGWRIVRTQAEHAANTGLDPLVEPQGWIDHVIAENGETTPLSFNLLAFSSQVKQEDPRFYSASLSYGRCGSDRQPLKLSLSCARTDPDHNMTLQEWARVIETFVAWHPPLYVSVGPSSYGIYDRVFDHRAWDGWLGWFPAEVPQAGLPNGTQTLPIGQGTLVATQDTNVIARLADHRARAQAVEIALVEMGLLPTETMLNGT